MLTEYLMNYGRHKMNSKILEYSNLSKTWTFHAVKKLLEINWTRK